jgi:hypothetical protein
MKIVEVLVISGGRSRHPWPALEQLCRGPRHSRPHALICDARKFVLTTLKDPTMQ